MNMAPGGSASEVMRILNDTNQAFTVSLQAAGTQNSFWNDLQMGVWKDGTAAPNPLPPLLQWTTQANNLGSGPLPPGQTVKYKIELYLPTTAGNADQTRPRSSISSGARPPEPLPALEGTISLRGVSPKGLGAYADTP